MVLSLAQIAIRNGAKLFPGATKVIQKAAGKMLDQLSGTMTRSSAEEQTKRLIRKQFKELEIPKKSLGGLTTTVPPKKGPNSQVPPVKLKGGDVQLEVLSLKSVLMIKNFKDIVILLITMVL
jgi:hypothetical protein